MPVDNNIPIIPSVYSCKEHQGITLLDFYAGLAMQAMIARGSTYISIPDASFIYAKDMLNARAALNATS